jgi:hypothetical protein
MGVERTKVMRINGTIPITGYDRSETSGECGIFYLFG